MSDEQNLILITRDQEKSLTLSKALQNKGFKTIIFPLFRVLSNKISFFQNIIFKINSKNIVFVISSSNSINYLEQIKLNKNIPIFSIGENTTKNLEKLGYKNIKTAQNSAVSLLKLVKNSISKKNLVIYLSGEIITLDVAKKLKEDGFKAKKNISYKIVEQQFLSDEIIAKIQNNQITQVVIYSKNTLKIFNKLLSKHNLLEYCKVIKLLCLSNEIINYSREIGFPKSENINKILIDNV